MTNAARSIAAALESGLFENEDLSTIKDLFRVWISLERRMNEAQPEADDDAQTMIDAQTSIMNMVAHMPSRTIDDVLYKLAIWRHDCDDPVPELDRKGRLVYSALRDLSTMIGDPSVLKDEDIETDFFRVSPK